MNPVRQKREISHFDQLKEVLQGWEADPVQLSAGPLNLVTETFSSAAFTLLRLSLAPRIVDRAVVHPGVIGFVLAERPQIWCGLEIEPPALMVVRSGRETRSILEPGFRSLEVYFAEDDIADHRLGRLLASRLEPECSIYPVSRNAARALRAAAAAVFAWTERSPLGPEAGTLQAAAQGRFLELLEGIVEAPRRTAREDLWRPTRRARSPLALAALDEIQRHGGHHVRLADIVARLGVSNRALEKAFRSVVGVSPGQYLLACRLNRVRERLNAGSGRVLDSALDAGFADQSRFASQYRRLFGELPSQTLSRSRAVRC